MQLVNLPYNKLEELLPYIDTLILPVGGFTVPNYAEDPIGNDLLQVRQIAEGVEQQLTGRVFLLPEVIYTNFQLSDQNGMSSQILGKYLYEVILCFKQIGFAKIVLLYGNETLTETIDWTAAQLLDAGFQVLPLSIQQKEGNEQSDFSSIEQQVIQKIIGLWQS